MNATMLALATAALVAAATVDSEYAAMVQQWRGSWFRAAPDRRRTIAHPDTDGDIR